jgi:hypothetical protein
MAAGSDDHSVTGPPPTYPCPACGAHADLTGGCSGCGRPPDPEAAEVIRLDRLLAELAVREQRWRQAHAEVLAEAARVRADRDALAARVVAAAARPPGPAPDVPPPGAVPPGAPPPGAAAAPPETSTRTVQTLLFVIGGLLLGTGAIVFTAVAWTTFGVTGRAVILAAVTGLVLATPPVALRRGLRGTAETFAALGLLLVVLDGYAVWSVDLFGARGVPAATWTGLVCALSAGVALGYARGTGLSGPGYAALVLAQPVLPMLAVELHPDRAGWAYVWVGVAAVNLAVRWRVGATHRALRAVAWTLTGTALGLAAVLGLVELLRSTGPGRGALAGGAVLAAVAGLAGVAAVSGRPGWRGTAAAVAVPAVALVAGQVATLARPGYGLVAAAAATAAAAGLAVLSGRRWPGLRLGTLIGGLVATGSVGLAATAATLWRAAEVTAGWPFPPAGPYDWQLPVALVLLAAALVALVPAGWREFVAGGLALLALATPASLPVAWWVPAAVDLAVAAALGLVAVRARTRTAVVGAAATVGLVLHALLVGFATATATAGVLGAVVLLGTVLAADAHRLGPDAGPRRVVGRGALLVGLLAWPPAVAAAVLAAGAPEAWPPRAALASTAVLVAVVALVRRAAPSYLSTAAAAVHVTTPVAIVAGLLDPEPVVSVYAGGALLVLVATGWLRRPVHRLRWALARVPAALVVLAAAAAQLAVVLFGPYTWLADIWAGRPGGAGVTAGATWPDNPADPVGLALLAVAVALAGHALTGRWRTGLRAALLVAPAALLTGLAQLDVPWPAVPAVSLVLGVAALLAAAAVPGSVGPAVPGPAGRPGGGPAAVATGYGLVLAGAGLAGSLPMRWSTVVALGVALTVAAAIGAAGRPAGARVAGWLAAVVSAVTLAVAATLAADLPLRTAAWWVLLAAAVALGLSGRLRPRRAEAAAVEGAANGAAVVALLLAAGAAGSAAGSAGSAGQAAVVAALWGVGLGLRALWPGLARAGRTGRAVAAAGAELLAWWLLLADRDVVTVEAYTLPAAGVAAVVGWLVLRTRPEVGSWVALGPALLAAFLPSLFVALADPVPLRRLLLGAGAVAVVVVGAQRRWRAPVLLGGGVALVVALRELVLVWQRVPSWIPLTVAGLLLVTLAATYERRRRDLTRLRQAVDRMR